MPPSPALALTPAELVARRNALAVRWLWLVEKIIQQEFHGRGDHDDLYSEGQYALLLVAGDPRIDEGRRPGAYLSRAIRWAMLHEVRRAARRAGRCCALDDESAQALPDPRDGQSSVDDRAAHAETLLQTLGPIETRAVALTYGIDGGPRLTREEIGREMGLDRRRVGEILRRARRRMGDASAEVRERLGVAS